MNKNSEVYLQKSITSVNHIKNISDLRLLLIQKLNDIINNKIDEHQLQSICKASDQILKSLIVEMNYLKHFDHNNKIEFLEEK